MKKLVVLTLLFFFTIVQVHFGFISFSLDSSMTSSWKVNFSDFGVWNAENFLTTNERFNESKVVTGVHIAVDGGDPGKVIGWPGIVDGFVVNV